MRFGSTRRAFVKHLRGCNHCAPRRRRDRHALKLRVVTDVVVFFAALLRILRRTLLV